MKKIKLFMLAVVVMLFTACHDKIWDSIEDLDSRVTKLEELCKEMNTNISALQTIVSVLQENDYISGIMPIEKGGEVIGYTIMFGKHDPITIYNGEDGKDSTNGSSGSTPIIGVAKDTDGVYYWTLNGEWLLDADGNKIRVTGENGKNGADGKDDVDGVNGEDGKDGQNGTNGTNGKDGVTPQLKIEEGYWYVSYDNGATWTEVGKAVGENGEKGDKGDKGDQGDKGDAGQNGDSMFASVTFDDKNVYFTLTNGTVLIVPRGSENSSTEENNPSDIIKFEDLNVKIALLKMGGIDTNDDSEISYEEAANYNGKLSFSTGNNDNPILSFKEFQYFTRVTSFSFGDLRNLYEIILPNTIDTIKSHTFLRCYNLKKINFPDNLVCISSNAFMDCEKLDSITLPSGIKSIETDAFEGCNNLDIVNIKMKNIEDYCNNSKIQQLLLRDYNTKYCDNVYLICNGKKITELEIPESVNAIDKYAFYKCKNITSATISNSVTSIGKLAFANCSSLTSVTMPNSITSLGDSTFFNCSSLVSVTIPNNVTSIGTKAFYGCDALTSITIPENVTSIGYYAFATCDKLTTVYSKSPVPPTVSNTFYNTKIGIIYVPTASVDVYKNAYGWKDFANKIVGYEF